MSRAMLFALLGVLLLTDFAFGRGGGHHMSATGGAAGTSPTAPGTNSLGAALSSAGVGSASKGAALGTGDPVADREDARADKMVKSICRGC